MTGVQTCALPISPILSIKIVSSLDEAISHIEQYGSSHTDTIVTENKTSARKFLAEVDSSSVMVNASTAFADGFEYGLGVTKFGPKIRSKNHLERFQDPIIRRVHCRLILHLWPGEK